MGNVNRTDSNRLAAIRSLIVHLVRTDGRGSFNPSLEDVDWRKVYE